MKKGQRKLLFKEYWDVQSINAAAAAKSLQSCPTLCDPRDGSPQGPPIPGILQARTLERVAISFSNAWKWKVKVKSLSHVRLFETPWTAAYQPPPSMGFSRQEYWSGVPLPSLGVNARWFFFIDYLISLCDTLQGVSGVFPIFIDEAVTNLPQIIHQIRAVLVNKICLTQWPCF